MPPQRKLWEIRESKEFAKRRDALGDVKRIDEALRGFYWILARDPNSFPRISEAAQVRIAEIGPLLSDEGELQTCMILFRIEDEDGVELLWIQAYNIE